MVWQFAGQYPPQLEEERLPNVEGALDDGPVGRRVVPERLGDRGVERLALDHEVAGPQIGPTIEGVVQRDRLRRQVDEPLRCDFVRGPPGCPTRQGDRADKHNAQAPEAQCARLDLSGQASQRPHHHDPRHDRERPGQQHRRVQMYPTSAHGPGDQTGDAPREDSPRSTQRPVSGDSHHETDEETSDRAVECSRGQGTQPEMSVEDCNEHTYQGRHERCDGEPNAR
ncbi:hypothetical protein SDC9_96253 [bioreactor metagenome]|uniref:Uncharacterized protein n=1 Tax=bioreactor metagenome TaxID=1076179 RepID=A0A645AFB0_9ZZZZ